MHAKLSMRIRVIAIFSLIVLCVAIMGGIMLLRLRDLGSATLGLQDNATTLMQFGGFSSDFERLARLDITGQLALPDQARRRLQAEEAETRHHMEQLWTAYTPSISPGEEADFAATLKTAWGNFSAVEQRLEGLEQAGDRDGAASLITGDFAAMSTRFRTAIEAATGLQDRQARAIAAGADRTVSSSYIWIIAIFALTLAVALAGALLTIFGDIRLIRALTAAMTRLAGNDLATAIPGAGRGDEVGAMSGAVQVFKDSMIAREKAEAEIAEQRRTAEQQRAEREGRERQAIAEISGLCDRIADGDLDQRLDEAGKDGFLLTLCQRLNGLTGMLQQITGEMATVTAGMAEGDLTRSVEGSYRGVFGTLKDSVNAMADKLRGFALQLQQSAATVRSAAAEISTGSQDLAQRTESQAASVEETAASMHEITTTVKQNAENAAAANQLAGSARQSAEKGGSVVRDAVAAVSQIEQSARKIADIVGLIDEIAFQTNLLALNASVEAARAGEAGKGFAVVAQEVRALAQRSANASKDIKTLITESNAQVKTGAELVNQTGISLDGIVGAIKKVSEIVAEIAAASREQATGLEQINTAVGQMDEMTQRNGALVEETSASAQSLADQARQLSELVGFFRIERRPRLRVAE